MIHSPYHLGFYPPGKRVVLGEWDPALHCLLPGARVTVVSNYARTTGVVVVADDATGAVFERDGYAPLFEQGWPGIGHYPRCCECGKLMKTDRGCPRCDFDGDE